MTEFRTSQVRSGKQPFPWKIVDDVFNPGLVRAAAAEWPLIPPDGWHVYVGGKQALKHRCNLPPACAQLLQRMADLEIDGLFGCQGLFPDLTLHGAGLHDIAAGGQLAAHLDSDHHPKLGWTREISGVLFLNETWPDEWGGRLELLDNTGNESQAWISPKFNRLALFRSQGTAWHQVSPVTCPTDQSRKTLALFWWSHRATQRERSQALYRPTAVSAAETPA